jgi:hypothetical protein
MGKMRSIVRPSRENRTDADDDTGLWLAGSDKASDPCREVKPEAPRLLAPLSLPALDVTPRSKTEAAE